MLRHLLAAAWLLVGLFMPLACQNDRKIIDKHEQTLQEEDDG